MGRISVTIVIEKEVTVYHTNEIGYLNQTYSATTLALKTLGKLFNVTKSLFLICKT